MVLKITNLHILRYLPAYWLYLLERYTIDNQQCTHTASKKWLVKYKFKNWNNHSNGLPVTSIEKEQRAEEIANKLGDNNEWKTHGRPIDIETLKSLKLQITDFSNKPERDAIRNYYKISRDFIARHNFSLFIHTRTFL